MAYTIGVIDPATEEVDEPQVNPELLTEPSDPDEFNEEIAQAVIVKKSRHKGPNKNSRLLCPQCGEIRQVTAVENNTVVLLSCGDSRTAGILPTEKVSIEHMLTGIGRKLFPVPKYDGDALRLRPIDKEYNSCQ